MSFEQHEINREYENTRKKKKLEKSEAFWFEKKILAESTRLLDDLAREIAGEFGISISEAKNLIESGTNQSLESLKSQVGAGGKIDVQSFHSAINSAKSKIESLSKKNREQLKELLEDDEFTPEKHPHTISESLFSKNIIEKWKNPQSFGDECIGAWLWLIDSTEAVILFVYWLGRWILLTPYHIYLLITGKGKL